MEKFTLLVKANGKVWFSGALALMLLTGGIVLSSGECLKTKSAPFGIVSLELAWNDDYAQALREEWSDAPCSDGSPVIEKAKQNIFEDFLFLIGYPLFFVVCIILLDVHTGSGRGISNFARWGVYLSIASGLLDAIENIFMFHFLKGSDWPAFSFGWPATIKFFCVVAVMLMIFYFSVKRILFRITR